MFCLLLVCSCVPCLSLGIIICELSWIVSLLALLGGLFFRQFIVFVGLMRLPAHVFYLWGCYYDWSSVAWFASCLVFRLQPLHFCIGARRLSTLGRLSFLSCVLSFRT